RDLLDGPFFDVAQGEDLLLAGREAAKELPDLFAGFAADGLLFWGWCGTHQGYLLQLHRLLSPPFPPARAPPLTTGVQRHAGEPRTPGNCGLLDHIGSEKLEKDFLCGVLSLVRVLQPEAAELKDPGMMCTVQLFIEILLTRPGLGVFHVILPCPLVLHGSIYRPTSGTNTQSSEVSDV